MRLACLVILPLLACDAASQDANVEKLAAKCGSEIGWNVDPYEPHDGIESVPKPPPKFDRIAVLEQAKSDARKLKRLILCYFYRIEGKHMYRAPLLDAYMQSVIWSDPEIVEIVRHRFVPIRLYCDANLSKVLGIKALDFVEPMIAILDADGKIVRAIDRIRTFNADWVRTQLLHHVKPAGQDGISAVARAIKLRRERKGDDALKVLANEKGADAAAERGLILLKQGKLEEARKELQAATGAKRAAEAEYHLSLVEYMTGDEKAATERWRALTRKHGDICWGWKAASNLVMWKDTTAVGPVPHAFEDVFWAPDDAYAKQGRTRLSRTEKDVDEVARRAMTWLLRHQRSNGSWDDTRYAYWDSPKILPNVRVAVTALACAALFEWREIDPEKIDAALARAEKYALDENNPARGANEECYAEAYKILYLARKGDAAARAAMVAPAKRLEQILGAAGLWAHEYPNPFATAAVINCLWRAKQQGAEIPDGLIRKAADGLAKQRGEDGGWTYEASRAASGTKDSTARMPVCELALHVGERGSVKAIKVALDTWWANYSRFEIVRNCDFHSDGELAGFFFFHGFFHATEAAQALEEKDRLEQQSKFLAELVKLPELDGSFIDDHELGKSYGTAMALLALKNCRRP